MSEGEKTLSRRYMRPAQGKRLKWTLRMPTPPELVGVEKPHKGPLMGTGCFRAAITTTLNQDFRVACMERDKIVGAVRNLAEHVKNGAYDGQIGAADLEAVLLAHGADSDEFAIQYEILGDQYDGIRRRGAALDPDTHEPILRPAQERKAEEFAAPIQKVGKLTLSAALVEYLKADTLAHKTTLDITTEINRLTAFLQHDTEVKKLDRNTARSFLQVHLGSITTPRAPKGLTRATISRSKALLSGMWEWLIASGRLDDKKNENIWASIRLAKGIGRTSREERRSFEPEEWQRLCAAQELGAPLGDLMRILLMTGARLEDFASLRWEHVSTDYAYIPTGKTENARRTIPLVGIAKSIIERRANEHPVGAERVFWELKAPPRSGSYGQYVSKRFGALLKRIFPDGADRQGLVLHSLRHTFRTTARRAGVEDVTVRDLGGWSNGGNNQSDRRYDGGLDSARYTVAAMKIAHEYHKAGYLTADEAGIE